MKVAIVYDWLDKWGGVERVLLQLHDLFPKATFYTSYFDKNEAYWAKDFKIQTSFIQKLPNFIKKSRIFSLFLFSYAFENFNFSEYDVVISVTSSFAKAIITKPGTLHACYILTPTRYFYYPETYLTSRLSKLGYYFLPKLREWDFVAARRPDYFISISDAVRKRVQKYYRRDSEIIYPSFDVEYWNKVEKKIKEPTGQFPEDFYLVVSRLEPYKKVELVVNAFNQNEKNLVVVGKGTQLAKLRNVSKNNIHFISDISDEELGWLYKNTRALIMPQEEEFGYVALEAQSFGCPVIAFNRGGAQETVIGDKTGIFFEKQTPKAITEAVERFEAIEYNLKKNIRKLGKENVKAFSKEIFTKKFTDFIELKTKI